MTGRLAMKTRYDEVRLRNFLGIGPPRLSCKVTLFIAHLGMGDEGLFQRFRP